MVAALVWWMCKKTLSTAFYWVWPPTKTIEEQIDKMEKTLEELKELQLRRIRAANEIEEMARIDAEANELMQSSCPDLYASLSAQYKKTPRN